MKLSIDQLRKVNPFYQILVAVLMSVVGIFFSKIALFDAKNEWNIVCYALLCFIVANPILGILQENAIRYIYTSFACILIYLFVFLFAGKFGIISRFSEAHDQQTIIIAILVFYVVLTVISVMMKAFYKMTQ